MSSSCATRIGIASSERVVGILVVLADVSLWAYIVPARALTGMLPL
ncbi:MAG TPA: hypothetical protein VFJ50_09905 [Gemmatimonadales bacterium]|nr:hypothetical protein [Gemmatimonadales bacterium]